MVMMQKILKTVLSFAIHGLCNHIDTAIYIDTVKFNILTGWKSTHCISFIHLINWINKLYCVAGEGYQLINDQNIFVRFDYHPTI